MFHVSLRKQHRNYKIGDHGRQKHSQNLDATVTDAVQDRIFAGAVLFQNGFQNDISSAFLKNASHNDPIKDKSCCISVDESGKRIVFNNAEIVYAEF